MGIQKKKCGEKMKESSLFLAKNFKYNKKDFIVVAVSGGPDSMALLSFLNDYIKDAQIICAHVNHNVRFESKNEETFVKEFCERNNIIFETTKFEDYSKENFHSEARNRRYAFFEELIKKYHSKYLFTAHHADDLIETILMRISRGSTIKGYSGFSGIVTCPNFKILRPFINVTKSQILDYLVQNNIAYIVDDSNNSDKYTRNRYRKNVVEFLKKENDNIHKKFIKYSDTLNLYNSFVQLQVDKTYPKIYINNKVHVKKANKCHELIKELVIKKILEEIYDKDIVCVTDIHVESILTLLESNRVNSRVELPLNLLAVKSYDFLEFVKDKKKNDYYRIPFKSYNIVDNRYILKEINISEKDGNNICRINTSEIKMPLYLRNRLNGDSLEVRGLNGSKKIKDIFIDEKISMNKRDRLPLLVDSDENILWIPGIKKSKFCKKREESYDIIIKYDEEVFNEKE